VGGAAGGGGAAAAAAAGEDRGQPDSASGTEPGPGPELAGPRGSPSARAAHALDRLRTWVEDRLRPGLAGDRLLHATLAAGGAAAGLLALALLLGIDRWRVRRAFRSLRAQVDGTDKLSKLQQSSELRDLADQVRARSLKRSTLFVRAMDMLKAESKESFFQTFGEAMIKGFSARRCAFYVYDRAAELLYPKAFEIESARALPHGDAAAPAGRIREVDTPAIRSIRVTPGEDTLVGFAAKQRVAVSRDQAKTDVTRTHLRSNLPLPTFACVPVTSQDPVTREPKFIGIIAIGDVEEAGWSETDYNLLAAAATITGLAFAKLDLFELQAAELASTKELSLKERDQRKQIRAVLDRVVAPEVAEQLLTGPDSLIRGELLDASVLFADVRGFTTYSEKRSPVEVVAVLNEYLSAMTDVIRAHGGIVDKFVGDQIVAFWGALPRRADHAERAVRAALEMRGALARLVERWRAAGKEPLAMGMGVSTGQVLCGCIGSAKKLDFTVMGDTVNLGARLESLTRKFPHDLVVSEETHAAVAGIVDAEELGEVTVNGKTRPSKIFGIRALRQP
jgi:class 3 adenylate cyclase